MISALASLKLWERELISRVLLTPVEPRYCIVWEDPADPDAPGAITHPAPRWLAMALAGGFLPPIEAYLRDKKVEDDWSRLMVERGTPNVPFEWSRVGGAEHSYAPPIGPMTEREAMEYLLQKDIPRRVWGEPTNRPRFAIVPRSSIPIDRTHRNAWRLADLTRAAA